jgi:hypothetical protein
VQSPSTDLTALVEAEVKLARLLEEARADAQAIAEAARRVVEEADAAAVATRDTQRSVVVDEIAAATRARIAALEAAASAEILRYVGIDGARLEALARRLAARLADVALEPP